MALRNFDPAKAPRVSRRAFTALGGGIALALGQLALGAAQTACSGSDSTGRKRVELVTRVRADTLAFTNAFDWAIALDRALLSLGPLRYLEGAPVASRASFGIRAAHAHPGHYVEGGTLGEMLEPTTVDLTAGVTEVFRGPGVTGQALSARFAFQDPPAGELAGELSPRLVLVEGSATSGPASLRFRASAGLADIVDPDGNPFVTGCTFEDGDIVSDGSVLVTVSPALWLDQVDFSLLERSGDDAVELDASGIPHKAFARGLKKGAAYSFRYSRSQ
ncbi:MAG: hypothetical protein M3020_11875 [Myxococcota bacterium]|nr:hypothetical protein [Myxococcota bacterium]